MLQRTLSFCSGIRQNSGARRDRNFGEFRCQFALIRSSVSWRLAALALCITALGCGRGQRNEDFIPSEDSARHALDAYLASWQRGEPGMSVPGAKPAIEGGDEVRRNGRRLDAYEILGPVPVDAPRCFAVRLRFANPSEEIRERYVVVGMDPIWVLRFSDYEMLTHWDHPMPTAKAGNITPTTKNQ